MADAVVAFFDPENPRWPKLLKPGFRHVVAAIDDGDYWILIDARDGRPVFQALQTNGYDMAGFWRSALAPAGGPMTVIETAQGPPMDGVFDLHNCVGLVKAMLCIKAPFVITPYQLYKHLTRKAA